MKTWGWASLTASLAFVATMARAEPAPLPTPADASSACYPACRDGFQCNEKAECVATPSACFPECREGFRCNDKKVCVSTSTKKAVAAGPRPQTLDAIPMNTLEISSYADAEVLIDGGRVGRVTPGSPLVFAPPLGSHTIKLVYDEGGTDQKRVFIVEGPQEPLEFKPTGGSRDIQGRVGHLVMGFGAEIGPTILWEELFDDLALANADPTLFGVMAYGLSAGVDFQLGFGFGITQAVGEEFSWLKFHAEPRLLFHLGSVYTMSLGAPLAIGPALGDYNQTDALFGFAARGSLIGFQFGSSRQHRIELINEFGLVINPSADGEFDEPGTNLGGDLRYSVMFP